MFAGVDGEIVSVKKYLLEEGVQSISEPQISGMCTDARFLGLDLCKSVKSVVHFPNENYSMVTYLVEQT